MQQVKKRRLSPNPAYRRGRLRASRKRFLEKTSSAAFGKKFERRISNLSRRLSRNSRVEMFFDISNTDRRILIHPLYLGYNGQPVATAQIEFVANRGKVYCAVLEYQGKEGTKVPLNKIAEETGKKWNHLLADMIISAAHGACLDGVMFLDYKSTLPLKPIAVMEEHFAEAKRKAQTKGKNPHEVGAQMVMESVRKSITGLYENTFTYLNKNYPLQKTYLELWGKHPFYKVEFP